VDPSWVLSLPGDVRVSDQGEDELVLLGSQARVVLRHLATGLRDALRRLNSPGDGAGRLAEVVLSAAAPDALALWYYHLQLLARRRWLLLSVDAGGERLATLVPTAPGFVLSPTVPLSARRYVLSRFAFIRRSGNTLVLESPLSCARVVLHDPRVAAFVCSLTRPETAADLSRHTWNVSAETVPPLLSLLIKAGVVCEVDDDSQSAEDADDALSSWEFHDLLFHTRSREGRHDGSLGATYPLAERLDLPPTLKPPPLGEGIVLYRPDLQQLQRRDPPLARVQEERRSLRDYGPEPLSAQQLGEFLFRVARVKDCQVMNVATPAGSVPMEFARRPYPAGGALYELEVYAVVNACRGLARGLFYYDPSGHRLVRVASWNEDVVELLVGAGRAAGKTADDLQVLLIVAARVPRVAWKYSGLAYALVLKHVGVLYQTMYLAATAMGLAPCALGTGDSDVFARAAGVNYCTETSVGEFLLGSKG
jgi:SagB-type dehydrogenase family enzyme